MVHKTYICKATVDAHHIDTGVITFCMEQIKCHRLYDTIIFHLWPIILLIVFHADVFIKGMLT